MVEGNDLEAEDILMAIVKLPPAVEERLKERAAKSGLTLEEYLRWTPLSRPKTGAPSLLPVRPSWS
jgi:hypothetical protein